MSRLDQLLRDVRAHVTADVKADPEAMFVVNCEANSVEHVALFLLTHVATALKGGTVDLDTSSGVKLYNRVFRDYFAETEQARSRLAKLTIEIALELRKGDSR